jgi:ppGpp synthetase/RelA/SpoT-type nucleotidyltranferase
LASGKLNDVRDIQDLAGVRLIFYFCDDLNNFVDDFDCEALFGCGSIPPKKWGSQSRNSAPGGSLTLSIPRFWYDSFHALVKVNKHKKFWDALTSEDREALRGLRCEVQMRTIMQHAWSQAQHDWLYKQTTVHNVEPNQKVLEQWSLLAAVIRLTDIHLVKVRDLIPERFKEIFRITNIRQPAQYLEAVFPGQATTYGFRLLHGDQSDRGRKVRFRKVGAFFDLDRAIEKRTDLQDFKAKIRRGITRRQISALDRPRYDTTVVRLERVSKIPPERNPETS